MQTNYPQNGEGGIIASDWTALISHFGQNNILSFTGTEEWLFLGEAHSFFPFKKATFLKKLLSKPPKLGEARASVPHRFRRPWFI